MDKVSIIARDAARQDDIAGVDVSARVGNKADEGASAGALTGGTLGGITGLQAGALAIPGGPSSAGRRDSHNLSYDPSRWRTGAAVV